MAPVKFTLFWVINHTRGIFEEFCSQRVSASTRRRFFAPFCVIGRRKTPKTCWYHFFSFCTNIFFCKHRSSSNQDFFNQRSVLAFVGKFSINNYAVFFSEHSQTSSETFHPHGRFIRSRSCTPFFTRKAGSSQNRIPNDGRIGCDPPFQQSLGITPSRL